MPETQSIAGLTDEAIRAAMQSPEQLKRWLRQSNRQYLIFDALDLVEALPWPAGVEALQQLIAAYRDHRRTIPTSKLEVIHDPQTNTDKEVRVMKDETLELGELRLLQLHINRLINEKTGDANG